MARPLLVCALLLAGCAAPPGPPEAPERPAFPADAQFGDTRTFAPVAAPGQPEGIAVADGLVFVTLSDDEDDEAELVAFELATGALRHRVVVPKTAGSDADLSRFLGVATDARGRVHVADTGVPRVLRVDLGVEPPSVETYATIPELAPCGAGPPPCSPTAQDKTSLPNYLAFGPDGALFVTDTFQATVFRVPPGGGEAEVWFQDARLGDYGANGIAFGPGDAHLYVGQTLVESVGPLPTGAAGGAVWRLPNVEAPAATDLQLVHHYPRQAVDGLAFGASGRLYVTLVGQGDAPHGVSVLDARGEEVASFPGAERNAKREIPYHYPASVAFDDAHRSVLVTNQAFDHPTWWGVLEAYVDDSALPLHRP